jgi:hypothetical protein
MSDRRHGCAAPARFGVDTRARFAASRCALGRDNEGRLRNDEFACAGHAAGRAELQIWRQQLFDAMQNVQGDAFRRRGVVSGDLRAQRNKIAGLISHNSNQSPKRGALLPWAITRGKRPSSKRRPTSR